MRTQQIRNKSHSAECKFELRPIFSAGPTRQLGDFLTIGRDPSNDVHLSDPFASQRHARIERSAKSQYTLRDLRSTNGTFVNGSRIIECILQDGDRISFGETEFIFTSANSFEDLQLTSKNSEWAARLSQIPFFAKTDFSVLILGPSGTGKELLARSIHDQSLRAKQPFVSVNCSALSESLVESELFGHIKGSFTGASQDRKGAFETARGGTLFLDEIGDLPLPLQPKLLRALENAEIRPLGSDKVVKTNVRILAATHQNLPNLVEQGKFRKDLYFRLNVIKIEAPALADRLEDLADLVQHFCRTFRVHFSDAAIMQMQNYCWPGNIRELKNVIARAAACFPGQRIEARALEELLDRPSGTAATTKVRWSDRNQTSKNLERQMILNRLLLNGGNQRQTAADLGIAKSTFHDRLKTLGINIQQLLAAESQEDVKGVATESAQDVDLRFQDEGVYQNSTNTPLS